VNGVVEKDQDGFNGKLAGRVVTPDRR
jgi:hypothetical protein